jgi:hypothetical protein
LGPARSHVCEVEAHALAARLCENTGCSPFDDWGPREGGARALAFEPKKMPTGEPPRLVRSLQLRVLRLGLLQEGDVGVGVFPEREESFVRGDRPHAGGVGIRPLRGSRF